MDATIQNGIALNPKSILTKVDTTPTADSNNPVSSDGVKTYVDQKDQATNIRVDTLNTQIAASFFFKGSSTFAELPASGNTVNDTYYVTDSDKECWYSWNGTDWIKSSMSQADYAGLIAQLKADVSAEYSTSKTYKVGDYCLYGADGVLYICKIAVTTAGAFDSNKWQAISFGEAVGDLVIADDTQPTSLANKIWLDTDPNLDTVEVITEEDLGNIVAGEFDSASVYAVGDYCIHDAKLYVAKTATAANDGWIAARWQQVTVMGTINDQVGELKTQMTDISDVSKNLLYFTNTEERTLSGGATISFPGVSEIVVNNTQSSIGRISVMGNASSSAGTYRANLPAGTYTMKLIPNNDTKILVRYRTQADFEESVNKSTVWDDGATITLSENAEVFVTIAGGTTYDNRDLKISIVAGTENKTFEQYGEITAKDTKAREAVGNIDNTISAIEYDVHDTKQLIKNGLEVTLANSPICYYPKTFKNSELLTYGGNRTSTQGMCGNDKFLWFVNKTSDETNCTIVKYDILKDEIVKTISERSYGHANDMCYIEDTNEVYIISWVTGDNTLYSNGGTLDRISIIDADTLEFKSDFGLASIIGASVDYPTLSAICYNPLFKLFAGVVRPHEVDGTTIKNLIVWDADGNNVRGVTITGSGTTSGMDCDNKLIYCLFSYRLAYYDWATLKRIYYNTVTKVLADKEAEIGAVQEAESIVVNGAQIYVNANNQLANTDSSAIMTTIYKGEPASVKFLTLSEFLAI